jgi:prepilin-type N-terminal cleavage/methylation domain-containing protein
MRLGSAIWGSASHKNGAGATPGKSYSFPMKQGFTLPELMLVLAVAAILLGIGVTTLVRAVDRLSVDAAATHLVAAHQRARMMAVVHGQVLTLLVDSATLSIAPRNGAAPLWSASGPAASGVTLPGPQRRFTFSPEGLSLGLSNASLLLQRGSSTRTIVISRLGRIRTTR